MLTNANLHVQAYTEGDPVAAPTAHNPYYRGTMKNAGVAPTFALGIAGPDGIHAQDHNGMPMAVDPSDPSTQLVPLTCSGGMITFAAPPFADYNP